MKPSVLVLLAVMGVVGCNNAENGAGTPSATAEKAQGADVGEVLAVVNGVSIGSEEFKQAASRKTPASGDALSLEEKKEVLDSLIEEKLLYAEALKKGIDKDPKVQKVMVNTLVREEVFAQLKSSDFPDEVLQKYYEDHKSEFIVPEKVQIKRILIKVTPERPDAQARAEAEKLQKEVARDPESFKDVAAKYSEDPYKRRGGDVGFVSKEGKPGLDQAIVDKAFTLETGKVSEVFKTEDGYNIILVAARREQLERTFQQMKGTVLRKAKNAKQQELYESYVAKLREGAKIEIKEDKLASIEIQSSRRPFMPGGEGDAHGEEDGAEGALEGEAEGLPMGEGRTMMPGGPGPKPIAPIGGKEAKAPAGEVGKK